MRHSHYFQWLSLPLLSVAVTQQLYAQPNESLPPKLFMKSKFKSKQQALDSLPM